MKKSKKIILAVVVIVVIAVAVLLAYPSVFDNGDTIDTDIEVTDVDAIDNPFD